jgi:polyhydroxyalkanoate synthesis repressor PhaR
LRLLTLKPLFLTEFALPLHCAILSLDDPWIGHGDRYEPESSGVRVGLHNPKRARLDMSDPRVIKKYPNRRLYDTVESRYITLADVRRLVVERIEFVVVDKKNNADITRSILLQVISEQEHLAEPILSQDFMVNVIRAYGTSAQTAVSGHLEQNLRQFLSQQPPLVRERPKVFSATRAPEETYKSLSALREVSAFTK